MAQPNQNQKSDQLGDLLRHYNASSPEPMLEDLRRIERQHRLITMLNSWLSDNQDRIRSLEAYVARFSSFGSPLCAFDFDYLPPGSSFPKRSNLLFHICENDGLYISLPGIDHPPSNLLRNGQLDPRATEYLATCDESPGEILGKLTSCFDRIYLNACEAMRTKLQA